MKKTGSKIAICIIAAVILVIRKLFPNIPIDSTDLILIIIIILPWLSDLIKGAEFPGGWKIELQDVKSAGDKVTSQSNATDFKIETSTSTLSTIRNRDPNIAFVGLRIEIESRLRLLADRFQITDDLPLKYLFSELRNKRILNDPTISGLKELITRGNQAAHGARVDDETAFWAFEYGPRILAVLDSKLRKPGSNTDCKTSSD